MIDLSNQLKTCLKIEVTMRTQFNLLHKDLLRKKLSKLRKKKKRTNLKKHYLANNKPIKLMMVMMSSCHSWRELY
jgi:hypothetical protein